MAILDELNWIYFPKTQRMPKILDGVIDVFKENFDEIRTDQKKIKSNDVLKILIGSLKDRNFRVEGSKSKIKMPVLHGEKNISSKYFEVDAFHEEERVVLEVEAGMALQNMRFLKDIFEASVMSDVDYLAVSVCNVYEYKSKGKPVSTYPYEKISIWLETLFSSDRIKLDLRGILLIGYWFWISEECF